MKKIAQNSKVKALFVISLALIMALAMSATSFAGTSLTSKTALSKALKNAGLSRSQVTAVEVDYDDGQYEVEFVKKSNRAEYSYEYSKYGTLREKSVDYNRKPNYGAKKISKSTAISKVAKFGGFKKSTVSNGSCTLTKEDGQHVYEIRFKTSSYRYEYEVHARTGYVLEYSKHIR